MFGEKTSSPQLLPERALRSQPADSLRRSRTPLTTINMKIFYVQLSLGEYQIFLEFLFLHFVHASSKLIPKI